ncbi:MAG: adenylate/guanylate cyclase domain-containing protein [Acidobacteriota bacterium]
MRPGSAPDAELRQLTVLFCDLVGSTKLAESLDPEELGEITRDYQALCERAIRGHEGYIAQYLGDGVLVYFGYPEAHEDDARRAVRAALDIVRDLANATWNTASGTRLDVRLGIHTGPVVVGDVGAGQRREQLAVGMTPNLAARIQNLAAPGTVVVSNDTHALVRGFFDFASLGRHEIKGLVNAVTLYRVLRESGAQSRMDVERQTGLTPLTGRDEQLAQLDKLWDGVARSGEHTVIIRGEAGIGKSRIVDSFRKHVESQSGTVLECSCTPYAQSTPLFPIVGMMERILGFTPEKTDTEKRAVIEERLARRGLGTAEASALMAELFSISAADQDPLANYPPQKRRDQTLETLLQWLLAVAQDRPTLLVVEDMHWVDPTTLEFISSVVSSRSNAPLLVIVTSRPQFATPWKLDDRKSCVDLARLDAADTTAIAVSVARGKAMPADVLKQIVARTEGVPLFVEEVTKAVLEMGVLVEREDRFELSGPLQPDLIPTTVQGSLNARLDRLGPAKAVAQIAATIGREFSFALLCSVVQEDEATLRNGLDRLISSELLSRQDEATDETYLFKHALVRDAAYQSLLKKSRRGWHEKIAEALTSGFPRIVKQNPELIAEHFTAAERAEQAVTWWLRAGQQAAGRAANHEAIVHLKRGIELTGGLPLSLRYQQELEFQMLLIPALIATQGWASVEIGSVYQRAAELLEILGESPHRFTVLTGTMGYHFVAGRITQSIPLAEETLAIATQFGDPMLLSMARQNCSAAHLFKGDLALCLEHGDAALALYDLAREQIVARMMNLSPCVSVLYFESVALWMRGFPERALQAVERAIQVAREVGNIPNLGYALTARVGYHSLRGNAQGVLSSAEEAFQLVREARLGYFEPVLAILRGCALAGLGQSAEGLPEARAAIQSYSAMGNGNQLIRFATILAKAEWTCGQRADAFATLDTAMARAKQWGEGLFEPELYRLKGVFLAEQALDTSDERQQQLMIAEQSIRESLDLARHQSAKLLELRSLVSLCAVRRQLGDAKLEREALADVLASFTEGFESTDLREAHAMLTVLGS